MQDTARTDKGYRGRPMEGRIARWYAGLRRTPSQIDSWRTQAAQLAAAHPDVTDLLEVAPGPGYFAIELARLGRFRVTALDISQTFVEIATENARQAGVSVNFRHGNASSMPFADGSFDLVVCQAAFKNFSQPVRALDEMHRVLRAGGTALVQDMSHVASNATIREEVRRMKLGPINALMTTIALRGLRRRAYTTAQFEEMAAASSFGGCENVTSGIGLEVRLRK
jgi:ubiquinone/menaquinone biosynthesis C-methylase UbiE